MSKKQRSRSTTWLLGVAFYVAAAFWLAFAYAGWVLVSRRHSDLAGWMILVVVIVVMLATINHWVKYLQVFFGGFILGCLLALGSGHLLNGGPFPRAIAAALVALLVGCSLIAGTLAKRKLTMLDRMALIAFVAAFVGGLVKGTPTSGLIGLGVGFGCLLALWVHNRYSSRKDKSNQVANGAAVPPRGHRSINVG